MQTDMFALLDPVARLVSGHDKPGGWSAHKAEEDAEIAVTGVEVLRWGKPRGTPSYTLTLRQAREGWVFAIDYSFSLCGGGGPFGLDAYGTREAAILAAFRRQMHSMARDVMGGWFGGKTLQRDYRALATWMADQCPPDRFYGVDLAAEWAELTAGT